MVEKGIAGIEIIDLDLLAGVHRGDRLRDPTGIAGVPVLMLDDGSALGESLGICRWRTTAVS